jgi:outer membrane protein assembly factor BamD (BamD/ComL family)
VAAEVLLLGEAHAAIRNGQAEHALALLDEHSRRFPRGALGEEREASRVTALCALGRVAEARAAADRFLRVSPLSPHAGRVRASCGGSPAAPAPSF